MKKRNNLALLLLLVLTMTAGCKILGAPSPTPWESPYPTVSTPTASAMPPSVPTFTPMPTIEAADASPAPFASPLPADAPVLAPSPAPSGNSITVRYEQAIHEDLPLYRFELDMQRVQGAVADEYSVSVIRIYNTQSNSLIQQIIPGENWQISDDSLGFILEDMNFDGYVDMRLMQFLPAGPNIPYYYWLWDVKAGRFVQNKALEQITSPWFDPATKQIYSTQRGSATSYRSETYEYIGGTPTLVEAVDETYYELTREQAVTLAKDAAMQPEDSAFVLKRQVTQKRIDGGLKQTGDEVLVTAIAADGTETELARYQPDDPAVADILKEN